MIPRLLVTQKGPSAATLVQTGRRINEFISRSSALPEPPAPGKCFASLAGPKPATGPAIIVMSNKLRNAAVNAGRVPRSRASTGRLEFEVLAERLQFLRRLALQKVDQDGLKSPVDSFVTAAVLKRWAAHARGRNSTKTKSGKMISASSETAKNPSRFSREGLVKDVLSSEVVNDVGNQRATVYK